MEAESSEYRLVTEEWLYKQMASELGRLLSGFPPDSGVKGLLLVQAPGKSILVVTNMTKLERAGTLTKLLLSPAASYQLAHTDGNETTLTAITGIDADTIMRSPFDADPTVN